MSREPERRFGPNTGPIDDEYSRLIHLWGRRGFWQVKLRWFAGPAAIGAALFAGSIGFEFRILPVLIIAACIPAYNLVFLWLARTQAGTIEAGSRFDKRLTTIGMVADYACLMLLLHFTGGVSSPILVFMIFHVVITAIQFRPRFSHQVATIAACGLWIMLLAQGFGWWPAAELSFRGRPAHALDRPEYLVSMLVFFTATLYLTAALAGKIMQGFRERVEELIEERTRFMLQTAHNLRAPLGTSLSMLELIRDDSVGPATPMQRQFLDKIDGRLRSLHQMIGEILTIAKARDWSREITDVVIDLKQLAQRTEEMFREEAAGKNIRLEVLVEEALGEIDSGANLLEQVMENLVSNAIKYTPQNGRVRVRFMKSGHDEVRIMVEDNGIGIPATEQSRLFEEFFRASNAKRASAAGTGLGLALVKQTVERHRGRIHLASEEGEGTTIVIDLPIRQLKTSA